MTYNKPKHTDRYTTNKEEVIQTEHYRKLSTYERREQENKKRTENNYKTNKKTIKCHLYIIITLIVSGLNAPIK